MNKIKFQKIEKGNIFCSKFKNLTSDNILDFDNKKISIVYAPNGTGKSSLTSVLNYEKGTSFKLEYNGKTHTEKDEKIFHVISDQNARNIIQGTTGDFILGAEIRKEYELKKSIDDQFKKMFEEHLNKTLKSDFNITKKSSILLKEIIKDHKIKDYIGCIQSNSNKGKTINQSEFINYILNLNLKAEGDYIEDKLNYLIANYEDKNFIISQILKLSPSNISSHKNISQIGENEFAIKTLNEFIDKHECIICDSAINPNELLECKKERKERIYNSLDDCTKNIFKNIIQKISDSDPFNIKELLLQSLEEGNTENLIKLQGKLNYYLDLFRTKINNLFINSFNNTSLEKDYETYLKMISVPLNFSDEDILYIQNIINEHIGKKISLKRNSNHKIELTLENEPLLGVDRTDLHLSTGEQNFISLSFELLKAKNSDKEIIVIDDPISSFDSIYKNKLAFQIVKVLENKKQLIFTHNLELIKLLQFQCKNCFELYLLNNNDTGVNGFIKINATERNLLLNICDFLNLLRNNIDNYIIDEKLFIISLIPFMRGYANIIGNSTVYKQLSKLMHGYETKTINLTDIYQKLFHPSYTKKITCIKKFVCTKKTTYIKKIAYIEKNTCIKKIYNLTTSAILDINFDIEKIEILNSKQYPLLNRTLKHSFTYLYLRLFVEKELCDLYNIKAHKNTQLANIIHAAFDDKDNIEHRVFFNSRKTLLNEFNHFEGNLNIFQPAIDISNENLQNEKDSIFDRIQNLKSFNIKKTAV